MRVIPIGIVYPALMFVYFLLTIHQQNGLLTLQRSVAELYDLRQLLQEEKDRLTFEKDELTSPSYLLENLRSPDYGHLHFPHEGEVVILRDP